MFRKIIEPVHQPAPRRGPNSRKVHTPVRILRRIEMDGGEEKNWSVPE